MKIVNEATMFKLLACGDGVLLCITTKRRAFYLFFTRFFLGGKVAPTTDPDLGIVELSGYDIPAILRSWERLWRVKLPH